MKDNIYTYVGWLEIEDSDHGSVNDYYTLSFLNHKLGKASEVVGLQVPQDAPYADFFKKNAMNFHRGNGYVEMSNITDYPVVKLTYETQTGKLLDYKILTEKEIANEKKQFEMQKEEWEK